MEEPNKDGGGTAPTTAELQGDFARLLALLLSNDEINMDSLNSEVERFISIYDPLRKNEAWMAQNSEIVASTYLVSVLVDRFDLFHPKQFLQLLLFCASICTLHYQPVALSQGHFGIGSCASEKCLENCT
jgi:hypothetical protein